MGCLGLWMHLLVLTDGSKGTWDHNQDVASLVATRQAEQRDAADARRAAGRSDSSAAPTASSIREHGKWLGSLVSARCGQTSSSDTIRGAGTVSTPTTATPVRS